MHQCLFLGLLPCGYALCEMLIQDFCPVSYGAIWVFVFFLLNFRSLYIFWIKSSSLHRLQRETGPCGVMHAPHTPSLPVFWDLVSTARPFLRPPKGGDPETCPSGLLSQALLFLSSFYHYLLNGFINISPYKCG